MPKSLFDRIDVKEPCRESWDEMAGNGEVRFCSHCSKHVHDLSGMTRTRAEKLVRDSGGSLCVRYIRDERGGMLHAPPRFTQIKRGASIAASVLATTLALSSVSVAQGEIASSRKSKTIGNRSHKSKEPQVGNSFSVTGTVTDLYGAVVPGALVLLKSTSTELKRSTVTNVEGVFQFAFVDAGEYNLEIASTGFKKHVAEKVGIFADYKFEKDIVLQIDEGFELVGELIVAGEPLACDERTQVSDQIETRKTIDLPISRDKIKITMGLIPGVLPQQNTEKPKPKPKKPKTRLPK